MSESKELRDAVALLRRSQPPVGFFFDFDGVLAPIQDDPDASAPEPGALAGLYRLAEITGRVSIVSARPVSFLLRHIDPRRHVVLFGLYGLERCDPNGEPAIDAAALRWAPLVRDLVDRARAELPDRARVEDKGLSLALHYREAPHLRAEVEQWAGQVAAGTGLQLIVGRMVVELRPPGHDKGSIVAEQVGALRSAWYFGDDVSDLEAFRALDARAAADPAFVGVRVAVANPETGAPLRAAADLAVASPVALGPLLAALGDELFERERDR
jgi:trehalose 6-phosphate phosphatase